jgi:hypothetical protein
MSRSVYGLPLLAVLGGCNGITCTDRPFPALTVAPVDSATGAPVDVHIEVIATDGSFADTARTLYSEPDHLRRAWLAYERPGTYDVTVTAEGYVPWERSGVRVVSNTCGQPETVDLIAQLQR